VVLHHLIQFQPQVAVVVELIITAVVVVYHLENQADQVVAPVMIML
jgi:hypothetical protein